MTNIYKVAVYYPDTGSCMSENINTEHELKDLQRLVNGYVEHLHLDTIFGVDDVDIYVNEEGAIRHYPYAFDVDFYGADVPLFGPVVFTRNNGNNGDKLNDNELAKIMHGANSAYLKMRNMGIINDC